MKKSIYHASMSRSVEVLVVGARCAGATLAHFLARAGKRVLAVDADDFPSDQPMSTHFIQAYGMQLLDELGVGDKVRAIAPPVRSFLNGVEDAVARLDLPPDIGACCVRRLDLDGLLQAEARAAGAEIQPRTRLVELLREGARVVGGVVERDGAREPIRAEVVVGADGPRSTVAELVRAEEYQGYDAERGVYWAYWPRPASFADAPWHGESAAIVHYGDDILFVFPVNRDQMLMGVSFPLTRVGDWKGRHREKLLEWLRANPMSAPLVQGEPISKVLGLVKARFFFRRAAGPGWALVGDAGLFKDPTPGLGISDAVRDARALATAIVEGGDEALVRYWRERDVASTELYAFARSLGEVGYNNAFNRTLFERLASRADLRDRVVAVNLRKISPFGAFSTGEVVRWSLAALLRGRFGVVGPFLAAGKRGAAVKKELAYRQELARAAQQRSAVPAAATRQAIG
jgi:flavin-dependent dehydrogenase